jgi:glycosyltransferase involved in cell wall biosynthesis
MKTLTVISPVYNEVDGIEQFYQELKKVLKPLKYDAKILFVLDRGTDGTLDVLRKIANKDPSVQVLALSSRFGHQMSLLAGIDHTHSDVAIMMDSDLQHPPQLIPLMIEEFEKGKEIVYTIRTETVKIPFFKKFLSKTFYRFINLMSDTHVNENAADFRLISGRVLKILKEQIRERNIFLRGIISWMGFEQVGIPFVAQERFAGTTKYSFTRRVKLGAAGIFSFSKKPLQAAIFLGSILALLAFAFGLFTCVQYFTHKSFPTGWATIVTLISLFSGIQLIFLGIVGEYIGNIFDEVKARPHYLVEEKVNF